MSLAMPGEFVAVHLPRLEQTCRGKIGCMFLSVCVMMHAYMCYTQHDRGRRYIFGPAARPIASPGFGNEV